MITGGRKAVHLLPSRRATRGVCFENARKTVVLELLTGLEPVASSLPRKCSTTELQQQAPPSALMSTKREGVLSHTEARKRCRVIVERAMGIEPTCTAWKAVVLPLNYARLGWVLDGGRHHVGVASTNSDHHSVSHDLTSFWRDLSSAGGGGESRIRTCEGVAIRFTV